MASSTHCLVNADVRAMDASGTRAEALAWRDGLIVAVGTRASVVRDAGPEPVIHDAAGATVLPGFIDPHQHPCIAALYGGGVRLKAPLVTDIADFQRTLASASARLQPDEWLIATEWDEARLKERRPPTRRELDDAVPDRPVFALHYSCHRAVANSRALGLAGIDRSTPDPSGGIISRGTHGDPDGLLIERGMSRVETLARASLRSRDTEGFLSRLGKHFEGLVAAGITRVVDAAVPSDLAVLYREANRRGLLKIPTVMLPVSMTGYLETPWDALEGPPTGTREGRLSVGPVKLVLDGAPVCAMCLGWWQAAAVSVRAAALALRYRTLDPIRTSLSVRPEYGRNVRTGIRLYHPDEARDFVKRAVERGFAVACHAEGNEAIETALSSYEAAGSAVDRAGAPRLEHFLFADRELVRRAAGIGAIAVVQPDFLSIPSFRYAPTIPSLRTIPVRWLLDAGATVAGSSDFPVTGFDPMDGIRAAVRRRVVGGDEREADQTITLDEALALYTRGAAAACACADECGTLDVGKRADVVVLSGKLSLESDLDAVRVRATVVGGELAFGRVDAA